MAADYVKIYFDGGSRGNPGPAAGAAYTEFEGGHESVCFLESATNNEAEYRGLLMAIELAKELKLTHVQFLGDSKLVVMQVSGDWQAKHPMMIELRLKVMRELSSLPNWRIQWIRREFNAEADRVANQEMDKQQGIEPFLIPEPSPCQAIVSETARAIPAAADIAKLNSLGSKVGFGELRKLKVGGTDAFSRVTLISLADTLPQFTDLELAFKSRLNTDQLTKDLSAEAKKKLLLNALRWSARGLNGDLALRKVLVDLELANSMRDKRK